MPIRYIANKIERFLIYRVLHVDDTPRRIALGLAIGIFVTWTPTMPCQMILVIALSALFGGNKLVGVPFVWISNLATMGPIYWFNGYVGSLITGKDITGWWQSIVDALRLGDTWWQRLDAFWVAFFEYFWELAIGSIIVGLILATITYFVTYRAVVGYRRLRRHLPWRWGHHRGRQPMGEPDPPDEADRDETLR